MSRVARFPAALALAAICPGASHAQDSTTTGPIEISGENPGACGVDVGEPVISGGEGRYSAVIPVAIDCNTPFTLRGIAALGAFRLSTAADAAAAPASVPYDVVWPASLTDASGAPIAAGFSAPGEDWQVGLVAVSDATSEPQMGPMIVRLRERIEPGAQLIPDVFMFEIEQN